MSSENKYIISLTSIIILSIFVSCNEKSTGNNTHNYFDTSKYVLKDKLHNKYTYKTVYINKYDKSWEYVKFYYTNGDIQSKSFYHNNNREGLVIGYYPEKDRKVFFKIHFKNDLHNGKETIFFKNGKISKINYYKMGKKIGIWRTFDSTGHLIDSTVYSGANTK